MLDRFIDYLDRHRVTRLGQVTAGHFDRYRAERQGDQAPEDRVLRRVILKQLFKWARSRKLIADNPLADVRLDKPPLEPKEGPAWPGGPAPGGRRRAAPRASWPCWRSPGCGRANCSGSARRMSTWPAGGSTSGPGPGPRRRPGESRKVPIHPRLRAVLAALPGARGRGCSPPPRAGSTRRGGHHISTKRLNEQFTRLVGRLGLPVGRDAGFVIHCLRHFFETFTVNAGIPQRVIDAWLGHRSDKSMAAVYYRLRDEDSQAFMGKVPFGTGVPAAGRRSGGGR